MRACSSPCVPCSPVPSHSAYREVNPAGELHDHLKPRKKDQQTALAAEEPPTFLHALDTCQGDAATRLGLRLLILTLARTSEVGEAKWAEFEVRKACGRFGT